MSHNSGLNIKIKQELLYINTIQTTAEEAIQQEAKIFGKVFAEFVLPLLRTDGSNP